MAKNFQEVVQLIARDDSRYDPGAYHLVREGLDATLRSMKGDRRGPTAHITGKQLSEGLRSHLLAQYGPMARTLLENWGVRSTDDFGNIVFNLIDYGIFARNENDRVEDFNAVFDFEVAFDFPFLSSEDRRARERLRKVALRTVERPESN